MPQIVLPAWQDCYENAARAEWLQIGIHANKTSAPGISEEDLTHALRTILDVKTYAKNARSLSQRVSTTEGRVVAAKRILEIATGELKPENVMVQGDSTAGSARPTSMLEMSNEKGDMLNTIHPQDPWNFP